MSVERYGDSQGYTPSSLEGARTKQQAPLSSKQISKERQAIKKQSEMCLKLLDRIAQAESRPMHESPHTHRGMSSAGDARLSRLLQREGSYSVALKRFSDPDADAFTEIAKLEVSYANVQELARHNPKLRPDARKLGLRVAQLCQRRDELAATRSPKINEFNKQKENFDKLLTNLKKTQMGTRTVPGIMFDVADYRRLGEGGDPEGLCNDRLRKMWGAFERIEADPSISQEHKERARHDFQSLERRVYATVNEAYRDLLQSDDYRTLSHTVDELRTTLERAQNKPIGSKEQQKLLAEADKVLEEI